jgi:hypothetical protein
MSRFHSRIPVSLLLAAVAISCADLPSGVDPSFAVGDRNDEYEVVPGVVNVCAFPPEPNEVAYTARVSVTATTGSVADEVTITNMPHLCVEAWNATGSDPALVTLSLVEMPAGMVLNRIVTRIGDADAADVFGTTSVTVTASDVQGAYVWFKFVLGETPPPPPSPALFLVIDEDGIDNGKRYWEATATSFTPSTIREFSATDVNDDRPGLAQRLQLRYFQRNVGRTIWLFTGQVGDEGWFAPKVIPQSWANAGPTADGLRNFLGNPSQPFPHNVGPGLGRGSDPERLLDKIPYVTPLRAEGLHMLIGQTVCALVWDSDISINYGPLNGSLKGEKLGVAAFEVQDVVYLSGFSSSTLPRVKVQIRDANVVCEGPLALFGAAPEPRSSSQPMDIRPDFTGDNSGYSWITR